MNLASFIALLIIFFLFVSASLYLKKHGTCGACPDAPHCSGHCSKSHKKDPCLKEKNAMIDELMKKHMNQ